MSALLNPITIVVIALSAWVLGYALTLILSIGLNETGSLPQTVFLIVKGLQVGRGDYVAFYPPRNPLYDEHVPFIKIVGGTAGDRVTEKHRIFFVNNNRIGFSKPLSSKGLPLHLGFTGVIPPGKYFVYTLHPQSFDSRYAEIGLVPQSKVIGRALPLF